MASRQLSSALRQIVGLVEDLLFPATCGGCGRRGTWLCQDCSSLLIPACQAADHQPSPAPGNPARRHSYLDYSAALSDVQAAFLFAGPLRSSIHQFKYGGEHARGQFLGELLADHAERLLAGRDIDLVLPVPLHRRRRRQRGFNQAEILARPVATRLGVPLGHGLLRTVETRPQVGLGPGERRANVRDAFWCEPAGVRGRTVLLVDDVVTTGATMEAAARALVRSGVTRVEGMALARQP